MRTKLAQILFLLAAGVALVVPTWAEKKKRGQVLQSYTLSAECLRVVA